MNIFLQMEISKMLLALGLSSNLSILSKNHSCISVVLHHILKELPVEYICSNAVELLQLIEITDDRSFDQVHAFTFTYSGVPALVMPWCYFKVIL